MTPVRLERWIARKFRLRHVELIAALYECRSILKASRRLSLTQPTLSRALQDVEATLGLSLFERTNRGLEPTPYGEIFARHAKIVLAQLRHAAEELESLRAGYSGKATVGTLLAASASILPDAIARLKSERPGVTISVVVGTYDILVPSLLVGDLDMVLGRLPEEGRSSALLYEEFYAEPICLVTRPRRCSSVCGSRPGTCHRRGREPSARSGPAEREVHAASGERRAGDRLRQTGRAVAGEL